MAKLGLFRCARVLGALFGSAAAFAAPGCGEVQIIDSAGPAPDIQGIEPAVGPSEGGTPVVITGKNFEKGASVRFGGRLAAKIEWVSETTLNVVTPPGNGEVSVSVENPGKRFDIVDEAFTYEGGVTCAVTGSTPELGGTSVPVVGELRLKFSAPLDATSLEGGVKLKLLSTDELVPVDVTLAADTDSEVLVRPKQSLRYWGEYAVVTTAAVTATDGAACAPAALAFATLKPEALPRALRGAPVSGFFLSGTTLVAASEGYRGLQVYDVTTPGAPALASDLVTSFSPRGLVKHGDRAYAPAGYAGVQIFDVADPKKPVLIGHGGTPGRAVELDVFDKDGRTIVAVAEIADGVRLLDATEKDDVNDLGTLVLGPGATRAVAVDVQGDLVAVANGTRVALVEVPDPQNLATQKLVASVNTDFTLSDVLLDGDVLYVARSLWGVAAYDISDPASPVLIDTEEDTDGPCQPGCLDSTSSLVRDGDDLFVALGRGGVQQFAVQPDGTLQLYNLHEVPGNVRAVAVTASHVLAGGDEGLVVFERATDSQSPIWVDASAHGVARKVAVAGEVAYATASLLGVQTYSLAKPEAPELIDRDDTPASLTADVAAWGASLAQGDSNVLAIGDGRAGLTLFDIGDAKNPKLGGTIDTSDAVGAVVQVGSVTYVCNGNEGVIAVDTTNLDAPKEVGHAPFDDFNGADACLDLSPSIDGTLLYVARARGVGVLDISDPAAPAWKALVVMPSKDSVNSVQSVGSHLVAVSTVFDYEGKDFSLSRLRVLDASDPVVPKLVWTSEDLGGAASVAVVGDKAFVAAGAAGVKVFDLAKIESPVLEGTIATPGNVQSVSVGADLLYVAQGAGGVQAIKTGPLPKLLGAK